jgi:hypothetical protein
MIKMSFQPVLERWFMADKREEGGHSGRRKASTN